MATIVSIHSFRGGTGKSNMTANLATLLAASGRRVAVIDTDIQSPGIHVLFGLAGDVVAASLNDLRSPRSGPAQGRGCVWLPCGGGAAALGRNDAAGQRRDLRSALSRSPHDCPVRAGGARAGGVALGSEVESPQSRTSCRATKCSVASPQAPP